MSEFMKTVFSLSFSGTVLMLFLLLCKRLYRKVFSKRWQYYIWLLVTLRFLLPFTPELTLTGYLFEAVERIPIQNVPANQAEPDVLIDDIRISLNPDTTPPKRTENVTSVGRSSVFSICLFFVWIVPATVLFIRKITVYQCFLCYLKPQNTEIAEPEILNLLAGCEEQLHLKGSVELCRNPLIASPVMTGFFRPTIILPAGNLTPDSLRFIFTHELIHYKRHDMFYKWLIQMVLCIHWFNPFVRLLEKEINKACELSCDEAVIDILGEETKKSYGNTLLSFLRMGHTGKNSPVSLTLTEGTAELKERLGAIMDHHKKNKIITTATVLFTFILCLCFSALGAYAAPSANRDMIGAFPSEIIADEDATSDEESDHNTLWHYVQQSPDNYLTFHKEPQNAMYYYVQKGYYYDNYVFTMGWNIDEKAGRSYFGPVKVVLADKSVLDVYFANEVQEYGQNPAVLAAISGLISHLRERDAHPTLTMPLINRVIYVAEEDIPTTAEQFYNTEDLNGFSALFPVLNPALQKEYYQRIYNDDRNTYFYAVMKYMDADILADYLEKTDEDGNNALFSIFVSSMEEMQLQQYTQRYYDENNIARFTILAGYMTEEQRQVWLARAREDGKSNFCFVLTEEYWQ